MENSSAKKIKACLEITPKHCCSKREWNEKLTLVSDKAGKDMPNKNPITIPAKVASMNIMPPFVVLLIELQKKKKNRTTDESFSWTYPLNQMPG